MNAMGNLIKHVLPAEWKGQLRKFIALRLVTPRDALKVGTLTTLALFSEAFGVAMILPLFEFIESNRDIDVLTEKSRIWVIIEQIFSVFHVPVSLLSLCVIIIALITMRQLFTYKSTIALAQLKQRIGRDLSLMLFTRIMKSKPSYIQEIDAGNFVNLIDYQAQAAATLVRSYSTLVQQLTTFAIYAVIMVLAAPYASLIALAFTAGVIFSLNHYVRLGRRLSQEMVQSRQKFCSFVGERFQGWRVIRFSNAIEEETSNFRKKADDILELTIHMFQASGRLQAIITPLMSAFALFVLYVSVEYLGLSISQISLFIVVLMRLTPTAQGLASQRQAIANHGASLDNVVGVINEAATEREIDDGREELTQCSVGLKFEGVSYRYPSAEKGALEQVNAFIPAGKMTAVMGASGAGKSTFVDVIIRIITPSQGRVLIDDKPIEDYSLESLRHHISYASQSPFVFNASVRENLLLAQREASHDDLVRACKMAYAHEFIEAMPQGYDTILGDGGGKLSGGQKQRIALARAFLAKANILILDEPTSSLDYDSEQIIQKAISNLMEKGHMTVIVIAHRLSTVQHADHIIVFESGRVVEEGGPDTLKNNPNWHAYLTALQEDQES